LKSKRGLRTRKNTRRDGDLAADETFDTVLEDGDVEIDEETEPELSESKVRE
jgi:hypothetical protein